MKDLGLSQANLLAEILQGSWRKLPSPPIGISEVQLQEAVSLLLASGSAALGWWRLRSTDLGSATPAELLHQAYRLQLLQSAVHETKIEKVFRVLRQSSIEPILAKGWVAARLFPDRGLRPCGDIDLLCRTEDFQIARKVLRESEARDCWVDLHSRFSELEPRGFDELFSRSVLVDIGNEKIRIVGAEDHLALLAIHLLKHGAWRPLWLCDIAASIESVPDTFDWEICLGRSKTRTRWILNTIGLAHDLLGAKIDALPVAPQATKQPAWLISSVLKQWASLTQPDHLPIQPRPLMAANLRNPRKALKGVFERWPDPVTATFNLNGQFNNFPRFPYQLGDFLRSAGNFVFHLRTKLAAKG